MNVEDSFILCCDMCGAPFVEKFFLMGQTTADTMLCDMCLRTRVELEEYRQFQRNIAKSRGNDSPDVV